jgi:hypothetical protein
MAEAKGMKGLVGRKMTKPVKFLNDEVKINKLTVAQVIEIQEAAKGQAEGENGFELLKKVIRMSVEDAADLTDQDFDSFPMDELSKLSEAIMQFSGIGGAATGK